MLKAKQIFPRPASGASKHLKKGQGQEPRVSVFALNLNGAAGGETDMSLSTVVCFTGRATSGVRRSGTIARFRKPFGSFGFRQKNEPLPCTKGCDSRKPSLVLRDLPFGTFGPNPKVGPLPGTKVYLGAKAAWLEGGQKTTVIWQATT
jgi:hypothetical protein